MKKNTLLARPIIGWREWLSLPELNIPAIKAKIDTGARTSALHAFSLKSFYEEGILKVRFGIHPFQRSKNQEIFCTAPVIDERMVTDSGGHREQRYVIETLVSLGALSWRIQTTLTNRDTMGFRMLLGRTALRGKFVVNPGVSFKMGNLTVGDSLKAKVKVTK